MIKMREWERTLLMLYQLNAQIPTYELARHLKKNPNTLRHILDRLETRGNIRKVRIGPKKWKLEWEITELGRKTLRRRELI